MSYHILDFVQQKKTKFTMQQPYMLPILILLITYLLMPWWLKEPGHQQARYWPSKPEYSVSGIRRVNMVYYTVYPL